MPADLPARDAASAVAAVLAVTPVDQNGSTVVAWRKRFLPSVGWNVPEAVKGDPTPIAARQAAAVLRAIAEHLESQQTAPAKIRLVDAVWLRKHADEMDGGSDGQ